MEIKPIARIQSDFPTKFGIPHQSGWIETLQAKVIFEPEYRNADALRGIEEFDYLWLLWEFSEARREDWSPTVRPPRLGGNTRVGVFASRSPFRPNPLGLSSVRLEGIEMDPQNGPVLRVGGADLMDGTPIYDIKPYIALDSHPNAAYGFTDRVEDHPLEVKISEELLQRIPEEAREGALRVLRNDPRPRYQNNPERIYGMPYAGVDIRFQVQDTCLKVVEVSSVPSKK